jgi:hypothetical protein
MPIRRAASLVFAITALIMLGITSVPARQVLGVNPQGPPPRDRMPPPRTGTAAIKGRVVDGVTGAAVARARVSVQGPNRLTAVTDGAGAFAFANLPGGPLMLLVEKATYMVARYPAAGRTVRSGSRPLVLLDGQVLDNITVPLFHGGAIMGRVLDVNGDPIDNAQISLMRVPSPGRPGRPTMRGGSGSDDRGEYRIGRLEAGTYLIQVNVRRNMGQEMMPGAAPEPPTPQPLPTYYPNALAIEQAQPITVDRGQTITDIDVVLAEGIPGTVNGVVTNADGSSITGSNTFVNVRRMSGDTMSGFDGFSNGTGVRPDGTFKLTLPPGEYQIEARVAPRMGTMRPEDEQYATAKIAVTSGAEDNVSLVVGRAASATGRVVFEGNTPVPPSPGKMRIPLYSETGMCRSGEATIAADWSFHVEGLAGTCSAPPFGMFGRWMLKAVLFNGADLAESPVTFEPGQQFRNVQVVVTDRRTELSFRVSDETGQPTRDYVVVVYPVEKTQWRTARIFVGPPPITMATPAGRGQTAMVPGAGVMPPRREALNGLRPGEYYVIAVDDLEPDDYRDPAVLERLRSSATRVTLPDGATVDVPLRRSNFAALLANR